MKKTNLFKTLALFLLMPTLIITGCEKGHTHDYGTLVEKVDATCTTMGHEAYYHCEECDKYFDASKQETTLESLQIGMKDHVWQTVAGQSATCDQEGHTEKIYCTLCGQVREESHVINPTGHAYGQWTITTSPTLVATGVAQRVCGNDNSHVDTYTLPALTDSSFWTKSTFNPTCTTDGRDSYFNSTYGTVEVKIDKLNHNFGEWSIVVNPTNDQTGKAQRVCANDNGHIDEKVLQPLSDAIWVKTTTPSTCIVHGKDTYTSEYGVVEVELPLIGHNYQWEVDEPATKLATGLKHEECTMCHDKKNEGTVIPVADCDHENVTHTDAVAETCETAGSKEYYYCDDCHKYYTDAACQLQVTFGEGESIDTWKVIPAKNHNYGAWVITKPTTEAEGSAVKTCANDANHVVTVTLPVINEENYTIVTQDATCTATGLTTYTLKSDTSISFSEVIEKKEHSYTIQDETEQYLKDAQNCVHGTIYYKHCECGAIDSGYTFEVGSGTGHEYTYSVSNNVVTQSCIHTGCSDLHEYSIIDSATAKTQTLALTVGTSADASFSANTVCVTGIVRTITRESGMLVIGIGSTLTSDDVFQLYKVVKFDNQYNIVVGAKVVAYGYLNHNSESDCRMASHDGITPLIVSCENIDYAIDIAHTDGINCTINGIGTTAPVGSEVSFTVTVADSTNYKVDYVTLNGVLVSADAQGNYKFTVGTTNTVFVKLIGAAEELSVTRFGTLDSPNNVSKAAAVSSQLTVSASPNFYYSDFPGYVTGYIKSISSKNEYVLVDDLANAEAVTFTVYQPELADGVDKPLVGEKIVAYGYYINYNGTNEISNNSSAGVSPKITAITENVQVDVATSIKYDDENSTFAEITNLTGVTANKATSHSTITFKVNVTDNGYKVASVKYGSTVVEKDNNDLYSFKANTSDTLTVYLTDNEVYASESYTLNKKISELAAEYSWANSSKYYNYTINGVVNVSINKDGSNGAYYSSDNTWRAYASPAGVITISAADNYEIDTVAVKFSKGTFVDQYNTTMKSGTAYNVDGTYSFTCTGNGSITEFIIKYHTTSSKYDAVIKAINEVTNPFATQYTDDPTSTITVPLSATKQVTVNETPVDYTVNFAWAFDQTNVTITDNQVSIDVLDDIAKTVKATLTASIGKKVLSKVFVFTTVSKVDYALSKVTAPTVEAEYTEVPANPITLYSTKTYEAWDVVWTSSNTEYVTVDNTAHTATIVKLPDSGTVTVTLTPSINGKSGTAKSFDITKPVDGQKTYEFVISSSNKFTASNLTVNGITWSNTLESSAGGTYGNIDGTKGEQFGTSTKAVTSLVIVGTGLKGTIKSIVINMSTASGGTAKLNVKVGDTTYLENQSLTTTATDYTVNVNSSGTITITITNTAKAFYIKSITIVYEEEE